MIVTKVFDESTKEAIISEMTASGAKLVEVQNHFDGNFLVFETNGVVLSESDEITALKTRVAELEKLNSRIELLETNVATIEKAALDVS